MIDLRDKIPELRNLHVFQALTKRLRNVI